jgi:hypothetical protein
MSHPPIKVRQEDGAALPSRALRFGRFRANSADNRRASENYRRVAMSAGALTGIRLFFSAAYNSDGSVRYSTGIPAALSASSAGVERMSTKIAAAFACSLALVANGARAEDFNTRIGTLTVERGYPSEATITKLYDEMDFQRAVQGYLWAMPAVAQNELGEGLKRDLGVGGTNSVVIFDDFVDPKGVYLTANDTTIYIGAYLSLQNNEPVVLDMPPGLLGMIDDLWQVPISDVGFVGPDKGAGGKFLILPPAYKGEIPEGYFIVRSSTNLVSLMARGLVKDGDVKGAVANLRKARVYPYAQREKPTDTNFVSGSGKAVNSVAPAGFEYWERLAAIINSEPVQEKGRLMMAMLAPLGIEKGKPFNPDARQRGLLTEAALVGNAMAKSLSYASRNPESIYYPGKHWRLNFEINPEMENKYSTQLDERTTYTYAAIFVAKGMIIKTPGTGSQYLSAFQDKDGGWLDGGKSYRLHVPANVPAKLFWSTTGYDSDTRSMVQADQNKSAKSSYDKLEKNDDGSVDLYFGPTPPKGHASNWTQTVLDKGFFTMFRWYGPTEPFFDKSWALPDVEKSGSP